MDISELLYTIKGALKDGEKINKRYYLPSFILKTIVDLYYSREYKSVSRLADEILDNSNNYAHDILREIRYWLCMALAKEKNDRFLSEVTYFEGADYYFLKGYYYRQIKNINEALYNLDMALSINPNSNKAKREKVNVLLMKEDYEGALQLANENYNANKINPFHIQAYFICLTRKNKLSKKDYEIIDQLLREISQNHHEKAKDIATVMNAENLYYIKNDATNAIRLLRDAEQHSKNKHYAGKSLRIIYKKQKLDRIADEYKSKYTDEGYYDD